MGLVLDKEEIEQLSVATRKACDRLKELGASAVIVIATFETKQEGSTGHNRTWSSDGNFFEVIGAIECVRNRYKQQWLEE